jgi:hypothetical protein
MSNELLQKVVDTSNVGSGTGGLLNTDQSNQFIDYIWDESALMKEVRRVDMKANTKDVDKIAVGRRLVRKATEGVDTGVNAGVSFSKITLTTTKLRLDWELTTDSLEDNIAGTSLDDTIVRLMTTQMSNDIEDIVINGDTDSTDPTLKAFDGFRKQGEARGTWEPATTPGDGLKLGVFNQALKAMPRKYLARKKDLRFYTSAGLVQDFLAGAEMQGRETAIGDEIIYDGAGRAVSGQGGELNLRPYGIPVREIPLQSEGYALDGTDPDADGGYGYVELTFPNNRMVGFKREVQVYREFDPKKDSIEYTVYIRVGCLLDNEEAYVGIDNVQAQTA